MSILLIGYRGSGKTTLGRALAERLNWPFIDLDKSISERAGMSIRQIFQQHLETHFRKLETEELIEAMKLKNHVISLGGGAVLADVNRDAIAVSGHAVVYLRAQPEELYARILADPLTEDQRPPLTQLKDGIDEIRTLLAIREPIYQQVKTMELNVQGRSIEGLVDELMVDGRLF